MILEINEVENLIKMLKSPDYENKVLAYKVIENLDFEKSIGELMLMYRLGDYSLENWEQYSKLAHDFIMDKIEFNIKLKEDGQTTKS